MLATISSYTMLTHDVLELKLQILHVFPYKPGQRVLIDYQSDQEHIKRAYSIAEYKIIDGLSEITLAIKLLEGGKGSSHLKAVKQGNNLEIVGVFGHFVLQETKNPKVFIGTGTGLVPLIAMANATLAPKELYFSVSHKSDLFFQDRIQNIANLTPHVHVTRDEVSGFEKGRINLSDVVFPDNTEFYICGNPTTVNSFVDILQSRGYKNIYTEKY